MKNVQSLVLTLILSTTQSVATGAPTPGRLDIAVLPCTSATNQSPVTYVNGMVVQPTANELRAEGTRQIELAVPEGIATIELSAPKCFSFATVSILSGKERHIALKLRPGKREPPGPDAYPFSPSAVVGDFPKVPGLSVRMCVEGSAGDCLYGSVDDGAYYIDSLGEGKAYTLTVLGTFWSRDLGRVLIKHSGMTRRDISLAETIQP